MGLGKYAPNLAVNGDMGWKPQNVKHWQKVFSYWNRCVLMCTNRVNKKIFVWAYTVAKAGRRNWLNRMFTKSRDINVHDFVDDHTPNYIVDKAYTSIALSTESTQEWESKLHDDNRHARGGGN